MKTLLIPSKPDAEIASRWSEFLSSASFATHYTTPAYFSDPYVRGERFGVAAVDSNGEFAAVATGVLDGERTVSGMFSRPQIAFRNDADKKQAVSSLLEGFRTIGENTDLIEIYSWEPLAGSVDLGLSMKTSSEATSVVMIDLSKSADAIFAGFSQTRRNEIRKAERQQLVEIKELETDDELEEMYAIHCSWNRSKGHEPDTFEQMQTAVSQRDHRRVFIAKSDGKVIAGSFYRFCPKGIVEYAANFSLPEFQRLRPNDLIGWHAIKWSCEQKFSHFSMGGSHLFLRRFGGEVIQTYRYRLDKSLFRRHELKENALLIGMNAYKRLPQNVRAKVSKMLAR